MKKIFTLLLIAATKLSFGQFYSQGDLSLEMQHSFYHDSTQCASFGGVNYFLTKNNSFIGDSIKIKDPSSGYLIQSAVNTMGQNPWIVSLPCFNCPPMVPDYNSVQGVSFDGPPIKVVSGFDTIPYAYSYQVETVTNPCSYVNLAGRVYIDNNADCIYDVNDGTLTSFYSLNVNPSYSPGFFQNGYQYNYNPGGNGSYGVQVQYSYLTNGYITHSNAMLPFAYPSTCTPAFYNFDTTTIFPLTNLDFSLQCTSNIDVRAFVSSSSVVRPGVPFILYPHVSNVGCDTVSGWMKLVLDSRVTYNAALSNNLPINIVGDTLYWNYGPISNLSNNGFWNSLTSGLYLTPDTTVNIGDTLCFTVITNVPTNDINASNNQQTFCATVVNSYDPNIKEVMPKGIGAAGVIPPTTEELTYTIYFQNTGNAPAINVFIIDTLNANIIPESLEILGRSHEMLPNWNGSNIVRFNFYNINLMDSMTNEPASHGFVTFKVKLASNISLGTEIENTAYIYFDFNAPIVTNTTLNTVDLVTETKLRSIDENMSFYPNPATNEVTLRINNFNTKSATSIDFYTVAGQLVLNQNLTSGTQTIDVSQLNKGIYIMRILSNGNYSHAKLVKE